MNNKGLFPAGILLAAVTLGACTSQSAYDKKTLSFAELSMSRTYTLEGSAEKFANDKDWTFADSVSMIMPMLIGNEEIRPLQDSILKIAFDTVGVDHKSIIEHYFSTTTEQTGFMPKESDNNLTILTSDGYDITTGMISNLSSRWLVYCVQNGHMEPRAAHGMSTRNYINYLISDNMIVALSDIFSDSGLKDLPALIARRAIEQEATFGPTEISSLPANDNFYISAEGEIVFAYQPYEIASYAQGFINVPFFPYELAEHMTPAGLAIFGLDSIR